MTNKNQGWDPLNTLEESQFKIQQKNSGMRPTAKNLSELEQNARKEDSAFNKKVRESNNQVHEFLEAQEKEQKLAKARLDESNLESTIARIKEEALAQARAEIKARPQEGKAKDEVGKEVKETLMGLGKLYVNSTNDLLAPIRFVMENKNRVLTALVLLILPAIMTWYLTSEIAQIKNQMTTVGTQFFYSFVFYFACMFALFTIIVIGTGLIKGIKNLLIVAKETAKKS